MMRIHLVFLFHVSAVTFVRAQSLEEELTIHEFVYEQKGVTVNFGLNVTGGVQPYSYAWDFGLVGGGSATTTSSSTEVFPEVSYPADTTGSYDVTVTVTDFDGTTVTDATTVDVTQLEVPEKANGGKDHLRLATYNTALSDAVNNGERALTAALATTDFPQAMAVAEVIQRTNPDILCLNEFDHLWISNDEWDQEGTEQMVQNFQINYLEVPQYEGAEGVSYEYMFVAPCNTGVQSGFDLDNDGQVGGPGDAFGFGFFPGAYSMVFLSKYPIEESMIRTFQYFLWKDMPGAYLPPDPYDTSGDGINTYYNSTELEVFRLSSKAHWDIPLNVNGELVHVLMSHPTPPVFDDGEATEYPSETVIDWNGLRNHDEIRFWADYVDATKNSYVYDDSEWDAAGGTTPPSPSGGFKGGERFAIFGDQNADPVDGDATFNPILMVLDSEYFDSRMTPTSLGGEEQAPLDYSNRDTKTSGFGLRADYVLPSANGFDVMVGFVVWPRKTDIEAYLLEASDHFSVVVDVTIQPTTTIPNPGSPTAAPSGCISSPWSRIVTTTIAVLLAFTSAL